MADPLKVKRNIRRMIDGGASEAEIDEYVRSEGVTAAQLRSTPVVRSRPTQAPKPAPRPPISAYGSTPQAPAPKPEPAAVMPIRSELLAPMRRLAGRDAAPKPSVTKPKPVVDPGVDFILGGAASAPVDPVRAAGGRTDEELVQIWTDPAAVRRRKAWADADIPSSGLGGRMFEMGKRSALRVGSGGARVIAAGMNAISDGFGDKLTQRADDVDQYVGRRVEGETTLNDLKSDFSIGKLGSFIAEQGSGSAADMGLLATGAGIVPYFVSQSGNIGQQRAENNSTGTATLTDIVKAAPFAAASTAAERLGTKYLLGDVGGNIMVRLGKSAVNEGITEGAQSLAEYTGGSLGTDTGFDPSQAAVITGEGALTGGIVGPGLRAAMGEAPAAARNVIDMAVEMRQAQQERDAFSPLAQALAADAFRPGRVEASPSLLDAPYRVEPEGRTVTSIDKNGTREFVAKVGETRPPVIAEAPAAPAAPVPPKRSPAPKPVPVDAETPDEPASPDTAAVAQPVSGTEAQPAAAEGDGGGLRPEPGDLVDGEKLVSTPAGNQVRTRFEVVPASQLRYADGELQNRDRSGNATELQVQSIVSQFDPTRLGDSSETDRGAPIVGPDDVIESGNGRTMVLNRLYSDPQHGEKAEAYRQFLKSQGYDIDGIENPVLIRRRATDMTDEQRRQFVIDSNKDAKQAMSAVETARSDRDNLTPSLMALYRGSDLNKAENASFVRRFFGSLTDNELNALVDQGNGRPTATGARRINAALLAKAYGDSPVLSQMIDSNDDNVRALTGAMLDVVGPYAELRDEISAGNIRSEMDINDAFIEAVERVSEARRQGQKIGDVLAQQDAFSQIDPLVEQIIRSFYNDTLTRPLARSKVAAIVRRYTELASEETTGTDLLGDTRSGNPADLYARAVEQETADEADLFATAAEDRAGQEPVRRVAPLFDVDDSDAAPFRAYEEREAVADAGPYDPEFTRVSRTNRQSIYTGAATALGLDPAKFRLLPSPRQIALLRRLIKDRFGVRVEVAGNLQERFAIDQMLDMLQNVQGMAHVLGLGGDAISLGGKLSLKLERNNRRYLGMYDPAARRIALPQRSNSFAHEWGHALDFWLMEQVGDGLRNGGLSGVVRADGAAIPVPDGPAANVRVAFAKLLNSMFFDRAALAQRIMKLEADLAAAKTDKQKAAIQTRLDTLRSGGSKARGADSDFYASAKAMPGDYWQTPTEMLARSFEAYVSFRVEAMGLTTEFIGKGDAAYLSEADDRLKKTFPKGEERNAIFAAFDELFMIMNEQQAFGRSAVMPAPDTSDADPISNLDKLAVAAPTSLVAREIRAWRDARVQAEKAKTGRGSNPKSKVKRFEDGVSTIFYALASRMRMISRHWKSPSVMTLHNLLTHSEGRGNTVRRTFLEAVSIRRNRNLNRLNNILVRNGLDGVLTAEQDKMLRDLLITQDVEGAPANFVAAASAIRQLLDAEFYENTNVGLDIGYVRNGYLPRIIDMPKVDFDSGKFTEQATKVYEIVFDNRFGTDPKEVLTDDDSFKAFWTMAKSIAKQAPVDLEPFRKANRRLNDVLRRQAKSDDPSSFEASVEKAIAEHEQALADLMGELRPAFGSVLAGHWLAALRTADVNDFDAHTPDSDYTKERALPPEADTLMAEFYVNNPIQAITDYLTKSAKRTEYARTFGPQGETRKALFDSIAAEGVSNEDQAALGAIADIITGRQKSTVPNSIARGASGLHGLATMVMLPRAVWSSVMEPITAGMRTQDVRQSFRAMTAVIAGALGTANAKERVELARAMGIIEAPGLDEMVANRFEGGFDDDSKISQGVSKMFKWTGLVALTRAQRTHLLACAQAYFDNLAGHVLSDNAKMKEHASAMLRELGVSDVEAFSRELRERGRLPRVEDLDTQYGYDFATATNRFIDQIIQNPTAADRPQLAANPIGRVVFAITSFIQAWWRNVAKREAILFNETRKRSGAGLASRNLVLGFLPSLFMLYVGQTAVSSIREFLTNRDRWEEDEDKGVLLDRLLKTGFSRTVSFGMADPFINAWTGLKYQRDLSNTFIGASVGYFLQQFQSIAKISTQNSPKTNTAEFNAFNGFYNLVLAPAATYALTRLPGGPLTGPVLGGTMMVGSSPQAGKEAAALVVGEKGSQTDPETGEIIGPPKKRGGAKKAETDSHVAQYGY